MGRDVVRDRIADVADVEVCTVDATESPAVATGPATRLATALP